MKICIKAWDNLINPVTDMVYDDEGLFLFDAIKYSEVKEVDVITPEIVDKMIEDFIQEHSGRRYDHYEFVNKLE